MRAAPFNASGYAKNLVNLAHSLVEVDAVTHAADAEALMLRAAEVLSRCLGPVHIDVAEFALLPLCQLLGDVRGRWPEAAQMLQTARAILQSSLPADHARVLDVSIRLKHAQAKVVASSHSHQRGPAPVNAFAFAFN